MYAIFMKLGLYLIIIFLSSHPMVDLNSVTNFQFFLIGSILFNLFWVVLGFGLRRRVTWHTFYAVMTITSYIVGMLSIPIMIGFLHVINGLLVISIVMVSMVFFSNKMSYFTECLLVAGYSVIVGLTSLKYLDYALLFKPNVLMHPLLVQAYLPVSLFYLLFYIILSLLLLRLCHDNWREVKDKNQCTDQLTGLFNYHGMQQLAELKLRQAHLTDTEFSVVVLDVDNFKRLSNQYGQENKDIIISHVAQVLRNSLRVSDMISRYDGDKFVLMLAFTSITGAEYVAEMCRSALESSILQLNNLETITVKASFGVSSTASGHFDLDTLLSAANIALNLAKENGKNQVYRVE